LERHFTLFATGRSWIEHAALDQTEAAARLDDAIGAVAFPDLHPGINGPIGAAIATRNTIYPHLIGNDSGCGIGFFATGLELASFKRDAAYRRIASYDSFADIEAEAPRGCENPDPAMGSIGGGNHFAEFTAIDRVEDREAWDSLDLDENELYILAHSGSRGSGEALLRRALADCGPGSGIAADSDEGRRYLTDHDRTLAWAAANRLMIARRCLTALGAKGSARAVTDTVHNGIEERSGPEGKLLIHRKGASKADGGLVAIAGSRGAYSYLVKPTAPSSDSLWSLAHGAGRKWTRHSAKAKLDGLYTKESIRFTRLGGRVLCRDRNLLFEEAPEAYKNIERVIEDLAGFGLIRVAARLRPILTIKD
jgi:release factor H-coupled RctB family protein